MPNTSPLAAASLREAIELLPKALPARGTLVEVVAGPDAHPVEFRVDYRTIGHALEWVYDGPVLLDPEDQAGSDDALAERIRGRVGQRCLSVRVHEREGARVSVTVFATADDSPSLRRGG